MFKGYDWMRPIHNLNSPISTRPSLFTSQGQGTVNPIKYPNPVPPFGQKGTAPTKTVELAGDYFPIREFSLEKADESPLIFVIGKPGTGRTNLVLSLIEGYGKSHYLDHKNSLIFTSSHQNEEQYRDSISGITVDDPFGSNLDLVSASFTKENSYIVFDEFVELGRVNNDNYENLKRIFHDKTHVRIIVASFPSVIPQEFRSYVDYVIMLEESSTLTQRNLYNSYGTAFPSFSSFKKCFDRLTGNYSAMVLRNTREIRTNAVVTSFTNRVFWYKGSVVEKIDVSQEKADELTDEDPNKIAISVDQGGCRDVLRFSKFDISNTREHPLIFVIGKRGTGKTNFVIDTIKKMGLDNEKTLVISPQDKLAPTYVKKLKGVRVAYKYVPELIDDRENPGYAECIVFDDCTTKVDALTDEQFRNLVFDHRQHKQTVIVTMQYPLGIPPELRGMADHIVLFAEDFGSNKKRLYDHYAGMFPTFASFDTVFSKMTVNHRCMVIHNNNHNDCFLDKVHWYKTELQEEISTSAVDSSRIINNEAIQTCTRTEDIHTVVSPSIIGENVLIYLKNGVIQRTINFDEEQVPSVNSLFDQLVPLVVVPDCVSTDSIEDNASVDARPTVVSANSQQEVQSKGNCVIC